MDSILINDMLNENVDITEIEDAIQSSLINKPKTERIRVGRPRTVNIVNITAYRKEYYEKNKIHTKGDILCPHCNLLCSKSNKSRHYKKYHPEFTKQKIHL